MWKKVLAFFLSLTLLTALFPISVFAQQQFFVDTAATYNFDDKGSAHIKEEISLENAMSDFYATSYTVNLQNLTPVNPQAFAGSQKLDVSQTEENDGTLIKVTFNDAPAGRGKRYSFTLDFDVTDLATRTGEVWEISIPKTANLANYRSYKTRIVVPKSFGNEAYINPVALNKAEDSINFIYDYSKESLSEGGITAAFGEFQVFSFTLNYHLENPLAQGSLAEITVPPDTAFQKVLYEVLTPEPLYIRPDSDGNWLATYNLKARERLDITARGSVQIYATPRKLNIPGLSGPQSYLGETEYWQVDDPKIRALALQLKTPRAIYDYVRKTLKYDYQRVKPNVERRGAAAVLNDPSSAICMEFTDAFIALARAAGIPAREINGYAYTENPQIQPLSLVADVLHAWPEYWDRDRGVWIPIDPTWGATTGGTDYFDSLDLRHFTFVIHGASATKPFAPGSYKLGQNPQKDVYVSFGQLPAVRQSTPQIKITKLKSIPLYQTKYSVAIRNPGPSALYNFKVQVNFDKNLYKEYPIAFLPPFSETTEEIIIPYSLLAQNIPNQIEVRTANARTVLQTNRQLAIIYNLAAIFAVLALGLLALLARAYREKTKAFGTWIINKFHAGAKNTKTTQDISNRS